MSGPPVPAARARWLGRIDRLVVSPRGETIAAVALACACLAYAALALYLTRGATFTGDQLAWFAQADGYGPRTLLEPYNDHIIAVTRLQVTLSLDLFGAEHLPLRIAMFATAIVAVVALWALLRRRIGGLAALCPVVVVLFLGSVPEPLQLSVVPFVQSIAAGLLAILALERGRLGWDVVACGLLVLAVLSFAVGAALAFGVAVWLALSPASRRRLWIAALPLVLFAAWYLWARQFDQSVQTGSLLLFPSFAADSLAAAVGYFSGLAIDFGTLEVGDPLGWGRPLAAALLAALAWQLRRRPAGPLLAGLAAALLALWAAGSVSTNALRPPEAARYAYPVVVLVVMIAAEAFRGVSRRSEPLLALATACLFALAGNLYLLRDQSSLVRAQSAEAEAAFTALELQRESANPDFKRALDIPVRAGDYLAAAGRHGSLAMGVDELRRRPDPVRRFADTYATQLAAIRLAPAADPSPAGCERVPGPHAEPVELPTGGAILESDGGGQALLGRFADEPHVELGTLHPGRPMLLRPPADPEPDPWRVSVAGPGPLRVCPAGE